MTSATIWSSIDAVLAALEEQDYVADRSLATSIFLAAKLGKPLLVEGEPGCGKMGFRPATATLEAALPHIDMLLAPLELRRIPTVSSHQPYAVHFPRRAQATCWQSVKAHPRNSAAHLFRMGMGTS